MLTSTTSNKVSQDELVFLGLSLDPEGAILGKLMLALKVCKVDSQLTGSCRKWRGQCEDSIFELEH